MAHPLRFTPVLSRTLPRSGGRVSFLHQSRYDLRQLIRRECESWQLMGRRGCHPPEFEALMEEAVHTVNDNYDGPVAGFADFEGKPHRYEREFDYDADEYGDIYRLTPIADDVLTLVMEKWEIWLRWRGAFHAGHTTIETHPVLPEERPRYEELDRLVRREIDQQKSRSFRARGYFRRNGVEWIGVVSAAENGSSG